ncbi:MAG: response regulator transcription factor [Proteobacteria bacterium]|nr:response regulator transcription factor [Pseudomonadota bacterium]
MASRTVFIVDDDADVRDSLRILLESSGLKVETFESAVSFLASEAYKREGCLIADIRMPDMDGLQLQDELVKRDCKLPVIVMTGHGDVPLAVRAMKAGAIDFLEKPFDDAALLESIARAEEQVRAAQADTANRRAVEERFTQLTDRERQVLDLLVLGKANKVVAYDLSISPRTVEIHRARVMDKMAARSLAELVRMTLLLKEGH